MPTLTSAFPHPPITGKNRSGPSYALQLTRHHLSIDVRKEWNDEKEERNVEQMKQTNWKKGIERKMERR